jgi:hypothetical protein
MTTNKKQPLMPKIHDVRVAEVWVGSINAWNKDVPRAYRDRHPDERASVEELLMKINAGLADSAIFHCSFERADEGHAQVHFLDDEDEETDDSLNGEIFERWYGWWCAQSTLLVPRTDLHGTTTLTYWTILQIE